MPMIGLGTDGITDPSIIARAIQEIGYRTIDSASRYKNEEVVGNGVRKVLEEGKIKREELFIITKVWIDEVENVEAACRRSLTKLGLDYVDLYLLHWPIAVRTISEANSETGEAAVYEKIKMPVHKIWP